MELRITPSRVRRLLGLATCCVTSAWWAGCRAELESTQDAVALVAADRDPAEDGAGADCWPCFRGRNAQGIAPSGSPAIRFGPEEGLRWKVEVPGRGCSSPVVWKDRVLLTTALEERTPSGLLVLCYDRSDGRELWRAEAGQSTGRSHEKNGHASASVATDGRRVVAFFGSAGLFCCDLSGKKLWSVDLGSLDHQWGTASSPVLCGHRVIQLCDCAEDSYLAAFDAEDGRELWRTPRASHGCWSTPVLVEAKLDDGSSRTELLVNGADGASANDRILAAYHLDDGRELWRVRGLTQYVTPTALVGAGLVYSLSGRNGPMLAIRPGGAGDVTEDRVVWRIASGGPYVPSGLVYRNRLYVVNEPGFLTCYNAGSGQQVWRTRLRDTFTASLVAADGRIYATSERGKVYVYAAGDVVNALAENELAEPCLATPAIAGGDLLIRTETRLYCFAGE
jgi:outer membrane protein assembly factor BamB